MDATNNPFMRSRLSAGLRKADVASVLGVSVQTIYNWETDRACPDLGRASDIASTLGLPVQEVLEYILISRQRSLASRGIA
jgi:DNA-binding XRE family transcriptional regulator